MKKFLPGMLFLLLVGCTTTQNDTVIGGLGGATLGGIFGHQSGHDLGGAAIGGAVGTIGGLVVGEMGQKKFCPVCGREYPADQKFCSQDGAELKVKQ
jgi:outer membrane lipoprotein SlyB